MEMTLIILVNCLWLSFSFAYLKEAAAPTELSVLAKICHGRCANMRFSFLAFLIKEVVMNSVLMVYVPLNAGQL